MAALNQDVDYSILGMMNAASATFTAVALTFSGVAKRFATAVAAAANTNKAIFDENGTLLAVTFASALFPTYFTVLGRQRRELESSEGTATTF